MITPLHSFEVLFAVALMFFLVLYRRTEDVTFLMLALICGLCAALSFLLAAWWPLVVAGILTALLLLVVASGWKKDR